MWTLIENNFGRYVCLNAEDIDGAVFTDGFFRIHAGDEFRPNLACAEWFGVSKTGNGADGYLCETKEIVSFENY